jgi:hypothetical protein
MTFQEHLKDLHKEEEGYWPLRSRSFKIGDVICHKRSGKIYTIVGDRSDNLFLEVNGEQAYAYMDEERVWLRSVSEIEDGRFVRVV